MLGLHTVTTHKTLYDLVDRFGELDTIIRGELIMVALMKNRHVVTQIPTRRD